MAHATNKIDTVMLALLGLLIAVSLVMFSVPETTESQPAATLVNESVKPEITAETLTTQQVEETIPVSMPATEVQQDVPTLPDFAAIADVRAKKQAFFDFMLPKVRASNQQIRELRLEIIRIRDRLRVNGELQDTDQQRLAELARRYRVRGAVGPAETLDSLLVKVDVVPESLVLAQAANESGWGTSRFARKANNMFGVWCFKPGCGLEPLSRDEGLSHEVARYNSVQDSVNAYIHTINTNPAYVMLRRIRADHRADELYPSGLAMAEGLEKYSARGLDYVREIQAMIRVNNLQQYTLNPAAQAV